MNNRDSAYSLDDEIPEFVSYLAERLGLEHDAALRTVGEWLVRYEPVAKPKRLALSDG
jgi:hypothetical protein